MQIKKVGVIGAGQMGNGIAHVLSLGGYDVILNDIDKNTLEKASNNIKNNLERQVNSKKISAAKSNAALNLINYTVSLEEFGDVDLVIEAATENESVKQKIFNSLCQLKKQNALCVLNFSQYLKVLLAFVLNSTKTVSELIVSTKSWNLGHSVGSPPNTST